MRTSLAVGLAAAAVIAGASTAASGESSTTDLSRPRTLLLHVHQDTGVFSDLDLGPVGDSPGDQGSEKEVVSNPAGTNIGTINRMCTLVAPVSFAEVDVLCTGAITLTGKGQIYWQSLTMQVGPPPPPPSSLLKDSTGSSTRVWAITGGTGAYRTARGQIVDESVPGGGLTLVSVQIT